MKRFDNVWIRVRRIVGRTVSKIGEGEMSLSEKSAWIDENTDKIIDLAKAEASRVLASMLTNKDRICEARVAKEKMKLVERIEGVARHHNIERIDGKWMVQERLHLDPRETYAKIQVLDDVLSALKSEEKEEEGG